MRAFKKVFDLAGEIDERGKFNETIQRGSIDLSRDFNFSLSIVKIFISVRREIKNIRSAFETPILFPLKVDDISRNYCRVNERRLNG